MATATSAGINYSVPPNINGSGASNNHGAAAKVGTATTLLDNVAISKDNTGVFGSTVVDGDDTDKAVSAGSIAHNHVKPISQKITTEIAGQASSVLLSTANDPSQLRSINKRESYKVSKRATGYRSGAWDQYSGVYVVYGTYSRTGYTVTVTAANHCLTSDDYVKLDFTSGDATDGRFQVTVTDSNTFTLTHGATGSTTGNVKVVGAAYATESPGSDTAASPTRSAPGDLVFRTGAKLPVRNRDYASKTG